jgi:hypothetical protein
MPEIERKVVQLKDVQYGDKGSIIAVFSTLNVIDHQNDMILPGAFGEQKVRMSAYGHGSWGSGLGALPVGKGRIYEQGDRGIFDGAFFLTTSAGRETYETVKAMGELQEWSYALPEVDSEMRSIEGKNVRAIKRVRVPEVSPVLLGASIGTQTLDVKSNPPEGARLVDQIGTLLAGAREVGMRVQEVAEKRAKDGRKVSPVTMAEAAELASQMHDVVSMLDSLAQEPEAPVDTKEALREYLRFQQIIGRA